MNTNRYYTQETALKLFDSDLKEVASHVTLTSTDSYSDAEVHKFIQDTGDPLVCFAMALNLAIVGYGQNNLGHVVINGSEIDIRSKFLSLGGKIVSASARLRERDITPGRLTRFFRYHIRQFLEENENIVPFLSSKYGKDPEFRSTCFRGAEYLDMTLEQADHLLMAADSLGRQQNFNLVDKVLRVYKARGTPYTAGRYD